MKIGSTVIIRMPNRKTLNNQKARIAEGYEPFNQQFPNTTVVRPENSPFVFRVPTRCLELCAN